MSETLLIAIVGAVQAVAIIGLPLWFRHISEKNRREDQAERKVVADKVGVVAEKVEGTKTMLTEIHDSTNSNYESLQSALKAANEKIEQLLTAK
jgi:hypothetical protein